MNSAEIDRPDMAPRITITRQGGISIPMPEAAATIAAARSGGYPAFTSDGIRIEPIAEASATDEPEMPENSTSEATTTMPSPPRIWPTIAEASATRRREMPLVSISAPASTNSGMATNGNGSMPDIILWATVSSGISSAMKPAMVASAMLNATGMPSTSSMTKTMTRRIMPSTVPAAPANPSARTARR